MKMILPIENLIKSETYAAMSNVLYQQLGRFGDSLPEKIKSDMYAQAEHYQRESEAFIKIVYKKLNS